MDFDVLLDPFEVVSIPFGVWAEAAIKWVVSEYRGSFIAAKQPVELIFRSFQSLLRGTPPLVGLTIVFLLAGQSAGLRTATLVTAGFFLIGAIGAWAAAMTTLAIVLAALCICLIFGLPLGIAMAMSDRCAAIIRPILDFMQTIPSFVYLVPVAMLFGIGNVPGIIVTVFFAMPPLIRLTNLGIRQVRQDMVEAASAFGSTPLQLLFKIELPLARATILAGMNQTVLLSLNMAVVASMIGVSGLGRMVLEGIGRLDVGLAAVGGLGIVLVAMALDRIIQGFGVTRRERSSRAWYDADLYTCIRSVLRAKGTR